MHKRSPIPIGTIHTSEVLLICFQHCLSFPDLRSCFYFSAHYNTPETFLREMLDGCGYQMIERVFVSCEYGVGKAGGALQRVVSAELGEDLRYVHIGDNQQSDVRGSKAVGWDAVWYRRKG